MSSSVSSTPKNKTQMSNPSSKRSPQIRISKDVYRKQLFKKVVSSIFYTLLVVFTLYLCFVITILRVIPTQTPSLIPVKNMTYVGGIAPINSKIVVNLKEAQNEDPLSHLKQAFIPTNSAATVEVLGGPYGRINWASSGILTVDGSPIPLTFKEQPKSDFLNSEYVVKCLSGACNPGEGYIISSKNVYGEPIGVK